MENYCKRSKLFCENRSKKVSKTLSNSPIFSNVENNEPRSLETDTIIKYLGRDSLPAAILSTKRTALEGRVQHNTSY